MSHDPASLSDLHSSRMARFVACLRACAMCLVTCVGIGVCISPQLALADEEPSSPTARATPQPTPQATPQATFEGEMAAGRKALPLHGNSLTRIRAAEVHFRAALKLNPESYEAWWQLAYCLFEQADQSKKGSDAQKRFSIEGYEAAKRATELNPSGGEGWYWRGANAGKHSEAIGVTAAVFSGIGTDFLQSMTKADGLSPGYNGAAPPIVLCRYYMNAPWPIRDLERATKLCRKALALQPRKHGVHHALAEVLWADGKRDEARHALDQCLTLPDDAYGEVEAAQKTKQVCEKTRVEWGKS